MAHQSFTRLDISGISKTRYPLQPSSPCNIDQMLQASTQQQTTNNKPQKAKDSKHRSNCTEIQTEEDTEGQRKNANQQTRTNTKHLLQKARSNGTS